MKLPLKMAGNGQNKNVLDDKGMFVANDYDELGVGVFRVVDKSFVDLAVTCINYLYERGHIDDEGKWR